jgi:hypothetical protein
VKRREELLWAVTAPGKQTYADFRVGIFFHELFGHHKTLPSQLRVASDHHESKYIDYVTKGKILKQFGFGV